MVQGARLMADIQYGGYDPDAPAITWIDAGLGVFTRSNRVFMIREGKEIELIDPTELRWQLFLMRFLVVGSVSAAFFFVLADTIGLLR